MNLPPSSAQTTLTHDTAGSGATDTERLIQQQARAVFGFVPRSQQLSAILAALERKDTLVVLPTGSGKSLIYQLIPFLCPNTTVIVISPLIALLDDQVRSLKKRGVSAEMLTGTNKKSYLFHRNQKVWAKYLKGNLKLLYMTPEYALGRFRYNLSKVPLDQRPRTSLLVFDECHLLEQWATASELGSTFRAECKEVGSLRDLFGHVPIMALTATLSLQARDRLLPLLCFKPERMVTVSEDLDRPEIFLTYKEVPNLTRGGWMKEFDFIVDLLRRLDPSRNADAFPRFVVYSATKDLLQTVYKFFSDAFPHLEDNFQVYHGSSTSEHRDQVHKSVHLTGAKRVVGIFATSAFGTGVDIPDIRFVFSLDSQASPTDLAQIIGRCARDKQPGEFVQLQTPRRASKSSRSEPQHDSRPNAELAEAASQSASQSASQAASQADGSQKTADSSQSTANAQSNPPSTAPKFHTSTLFENVDCRRQAFFSPFFWSNRLPSALLDTARYCCNWCTPLASPRTGIIDDFIRQGSQDVTNNHVYSLPHLLIPSFGGDEEEPPAPVAAGSKKRHATDDRLQWVVQAIQAAVHCVYNSHAKLEDGFVFHAQVSDIQVRDISIALLVGETVTEAFVHNALPKCPRYLHPHLTSAIMGLAIPEVRPEGDENTTASRPRLDRDTNENETRISSEFSHHLVSHAASPQSSLQEDVRGQPPLAFLSPNRQSLSMAPPPFTPQHKVSSWEYGASHQFPSPHPHTIPNWPYHYHYSTPPATPSQGMPHPTSHFSSSQGREN